ncbi:S2-RNase [Pyrus ussuriensis x Pyrus communis]|uniref:S2-RNase n=1 Tax=Pyrus ussuriensis x Pyrus communis TaxID=2448454 RepID=A0A5N5HY55_9ROSA|nr:S2-RNase [Pyrus ussuriensis x Pyrus communis]
MQISTALSNLEAESSLIVRLSAAMTCSSSSTSSSSDSASELEQGGLGSGCFLFLLKVRSKLSSNSKIFSQIG